MTIPHDTMMNTGANQNLVPTVFRTDGSLQSIASKSKANKSKQSNFTSVAASGKSVPKESQLKPCGSISKEDIED